MAHVLQNTKNRLFHIVVLQRTVTKCTNNYHVDSHLYILFGDVFVPFAVVVCLSFLVKPEARPTTTHFFPRLPL